MTEKQQRDLQGAALLALHDARASCALHRKRVDELIAQLEAVTGAWRDGTLGAEQDGGVWTIVKHTPDRRDLPHPSIDDLAEAVGQHGDAVESEHDAENECRRLGLCTEPSH